MSRCKHSKGTLHQFYENAEPVLTYATCNACGEQLPLGPSSETDERVKVEIRAAEIAANVADYKARKKAHVVTIDEDIGWRQGVRDFDRPWAIAEQTAGYLARCITEHGEGK